MNSKSRAFTTKLNGRLLMVSISWGMFKSMVKTNKEITTYPPPDQFAIFLLGMIHVFHAHSIKTFFTSLAVNFVFKLSYKSSHPSRFRIYSCTTFFNKCILARITMRTFRKPRGIKNWELTNNTHLKHLFFINFSRIKLKASLSSFSLHL